jgi:magnesium-transporting ATPase (P-type)
LTDDEAEARRRLLGPNRVPTTRRRARFAALAPGTHLMALLLWGGGAIALVAGLPALGVAIWLVNLVNGGFAAWQERRAERAAAALRALLPPRARVVRGGVERIVDAELLVPGDLIALTEGDRISADARLVAATGLELTEAALTGESTPVMKTAGEGGCARQRGRTRSPAPLG